MRLASLILAAVSAALVVPAVGAAADVRFQSRDEPVWEGRSLAGGARLLPSREAPFPFALVGLHWRGEGDVWFRTAPAEGGWSEWRPARPEDEDLPDPGTEEANAGEAWKIGNPYWTGRAERIQYRLEGPVLALRAHFVWSEAPEGRRLTIAGTPGIVSRASWGANERIVRARPYYADRVRFAVVHHTAGRNASTPEESAAIVRAIQSYHVLGNGWNDIGYNFLVDRFGQVFEGRGGGVERNVIGAHAAGFNTGSVGIAVIGSYQNAAASPEAKAALARVAAWRLDVAHVDPLASLSKISAGNGRFAAGVPVHLRTVSGHRDTGHTTCPGNRLYGELGSIAREAAAIGLPKLYEPAATGGIGGLVRFRARLSEALPWSVTVTDVNGATVASGAGTGIDVDWTWDASAASPGSYSYRIEAGPSVRPATGSVGSPAPLDGEIDARPRVVTPNEDGAGDAAEVALTLTRPATATVLLKDARGTPVATLLPEQSLPAGTTTLTFAGTTAEGATVPDGRYRVAVLAATEEKSIFRSSLLVIDRTLGKLDARRDAFSPDGDKRLDLFRLGFDVTRPARVRVNIRKGRRSVARIFDGDVAAPGRQTLAWDGHRTRGPVRDGRYRVIVEARSDLGTRRLSRTLTVDTEAPRVTDVVARTRRGATKLLFDLSEDAWVKIWYGRESFAVDREAGRAGFWRRLKPGRIRIVAWDAAGNASDPVVLRHGGKGTTRRP